MKSSIDDIENIVSGMNIMQIDDNSNGNKNNPCHTHELLE